MMKKKTTTLEIISNFKKRRRMTIMEIISLFRKRKKMTISTPSKEGGDQFNNQEEQLLLGLEIA